MKKTITKAKNLIGLLFISCLLVVNLLDVHSGFVSYQRFWTAKFHTMVIASYNHFTLNLSYNLLDNLMIGFEPQIGYKELKLDQDITKGKDAVGINFGMLYNF